MIERFSLLRNIGQFDSVSPPAAVAFTPFSFIYAENGRGKTTIAAILRSLSNGESGLITERQRLGSQHSPHIVIDYNGQQRVFQNGSWSNSSQEIVIFDDNFVAENVCSGIEVNTGHRQRLHELILGAQGVALNATLQSHISRIEQHNLDLKAKGEAIPATVRGPYSVLAFCKLNADPDIDTKILEAERRLAAAKSADTVRQRPLFTQIELPDFDIDTIANVLSQALPELEADAAARVRSHLNKLGKDGETWVADGMSRIGAASEGQSDEICPFCAQGLNTSTLIEHYRAYFSDAYGALKSTIRQTGIGVRDTHGGDIPAAFERAVRTASQNQEFWKNFTDVPEVSIDTAAISRDWASAREAVLEKLRAKAAAPLERMALGQPALDAIARYRERRDEVAALSNSLLECNAAISLVKEQSAADDLPSLTDDLSKLKAQKNRFDPIIEPHCTAYTDEVESKKATEALRDQSRSNLDQYRQQIFPAYEASINDFLRRFNAGFRIGQVASINTRAGSSASYCVIINQHNVNITSENGPSFKNTLSAGDRNTLALAFFFASLEQDQNLSQKIVVIDDPMTSLDEHRSLTTIQEMRRLFSRVSQMIVLSHSKPFLCNLWE
ncbi:MAG: AAA family ATPase, partial [Alteraurantiacibacter sp. bin_em_oilr2.035]|nr:AAA family ATPase [Alteraurantiacibacter sp. bin_em_oilr2.035]